MLSQRLRTVASLGHEGDILMQDEFSGTDHRWQSKRDDKCMNSHLPLMLALPVATILLKAKYVLLICLITLLQLHVAGVIYLFSLYPIVYIIFTVSKISTVKVYM